MKMPAIVFHGWRPPMLVLQADMEEQGMFPNLRWACWAEMAGHCRGHPGRLAVGTAEIAESDFRFMRRFHLRGETDYTHWPHYRLADVAGLAELRNEAGELL